MLRSTDSAVYGLTTIVFFWGGVQGVVGVGSLLLSEI